jgi:hypothetical protein
MAQRSDESGERMLTRMESGYMRHFSALVYAMDKASRERRPLTREDLQEGLKIARQVEDIDQEVTQDP